MMRKIKVFLAFAGLALLLSGCSFGLFTDSGESLYALPKLPAEYESLEMQLDALLSDGAEHVSPTSGSNLQSVQMVDLDSDGAEEAVAFLRKSDDEKPMKIYIFTAVEKDYQLAYTIEGTSTSIYSIAYTDLNGDGWKELLVGVRSSLDVQMLSVLELSSGQPRAMLTTGYSRYLTCDLDGDSMQEMLVIRGDEENVAYADQYVWRDTGLLLQSSENCGLPVTEVTRLTGGTLAGGESAVFLTGSSEEGVSTEVLTLRDGVLLRLDLMPSPQSELFPTDINGDGITEVPLTVPLLQADADEKLYRVFWQKYDAEGNASVVSRIFYNSADGWSLALPEAWDEDFTARKTETPGASLVTFYSVNGGETTELLTVGCLFAENRKPPDMHGDDILLTQQVDTLYIARLHGAAKGQMSEESLRESFSLISAEWTTGEN